ncbi:ribonuclease T2 family protein [Thiococcus pfennigii]|uniref:ribonuclease T2 family protein n=1 Tax=Thiococcus pfennigii TaxID=1057 RepID=UPI001908EF81|nr:ribonuclease I [Thiococcus pfennigii]MBK1730373.1 ribonuclease I [Thiococcus pfennigii]
MIKTILPIFLLLALASAAPASAQQVPFEGELSASHACPATKKKDRDNPGDVRLAPGRVYEVLGRNATPGTHYQIRVPGAPVTELRWVAMDCGTLALAGSAAPPNATAVGPASSDGLVPDGIEFVLAASWQPAFCRSDAGRDKPECRSQTARRFDATHFALHGLWPDDLDDRAVFPCYCDQGAPASCTQSRPGRPRIALSDEVGDRLAIAMPGMQSGLHRHEWAKHGTCYEDDRTGPDAGAEPDEYFRESLAALEALNASAVRRLFADHLGERLTRTRIEAAFDEAFGVGAGERVLIRCADVGGERVILELRIGLAGDIGEPADLAALIQAAPPRTRWSETGSCAGGRVVRVAE